MSIITLVQAKGQLRIPLDDTSDDAQLQGYVDGITKVIEDYKHEVIEQREIVDETEVRWRRFRLWSVPVLEVTSISSLDGTVTWPVDSLRISDSGLVRVRSGPAPHGAIEVTYQAGYAAGTVPANYVQGALVVLQHVWETRLGAGAVHSAVIGPEEHRYDPRYSYSIPRKALEWLGAPRPVVG